MDTRKIIWKKQKYSRIFLSLFIVFMIVGVIFYALGLQGAVVGGKPLICLVCGGLSGIVAALLKISIRKLKEDGNAAQKLRDCIYIFFRGKNEIGDAKLNVGLMLTIMDYYLSDEEKEQVLSMAEMAKTEEKELLAKCGETIVKYIIECFEKGESVLAKDEYGIALKVDFGNAGTLAKPSGTGNFGTRELAEERLSKAERILYNQIKKGLD